MDTFVAPSTDVEQKLARIIMEVLDIDAVGCTDDFFDLGGNSIAMMLVISRVRETFSLEVNADFFYDVAPNIGALARKITELQGAGRASS